LSDSQKYIFDKIYNDFFYYRNITFWKHKAMQKLPILINATRMMVCGEDLGMIPSCVPQVMNELHILSLEIQRMPKTFGVQFEHLNSIPYMSVCTTSTHDMNPVRAWWKENKETTRQFYNQVLWKNGEAPDDCDPDTAAEIVNIHLTSPAMWVILPLQDWLAMDGKIRRDNPIEERINEPSNPRHYWRYRMHLKIEDLAAEQEFNNKVSNMIKKSLRC
jgi:4-alpha-glucanotransferase